MFERQARKLLSSIFFHGKPGLRGTQSAKLWSREEISEVRINVAIFGYNLVLIVQITAAEGGSMSLRKAGIYLQVHIAFQVRRPTMTNPVSAYFFYCCTCSLHCLIDRL
jgi:hypothetical protein